jgi:hypothetical protein
MSGIFIAYTGRTLRSSWVTLALAILNYFVCKGLIEWNGAVGAAQSFAIINLIMFIIFWRISATVYPMPWLLRH